MIFPELRQLLKRFTADSGRPIELGLKNLTFGTTQASGLQEAQWYMRNGYPQIAAILGAGLPAWSGESVNRDSALSHPVVFACNQIVSESVGFTPAIVMRDTAKGKVQAADLPAYNLMKNAPNDDMTAQTFRESLTSHCLLSGNAYAKILRRSGTGVAIEFELLTPEQVMPDREKAGQKRLVYTIKGEAGAADKTYTVERNRPHDVLHVRGLGWNGVRGFDVISLARNSIGNALASERNIGEFWKNGGRLPYHLEHPTRFKNDEDFANFRRDWEFVASQPHKAPIIENGMKLVKDGLSMVDAQALETRINAVSELCRWFGVFPPLVQDLSKATFSNIEHLFLYFEKLTLARWYVRIEQAFWRCVLTPEEKNQGVYLKHNANALLRADFQTRMDGYSKSLQNGFLSIDEVRELEDRNPLPNGAGSHYHIQSNMGTIMKDGQVQVPQAITRLDAQPTA